MRYQDKSLEELRPILESYIERHKTQLGKELDMDSLKAKLQALAEQKEEALFHHAFEQLTPKNLVMAVNLIEQIKSEKELQKVWPEQEEIKSNKAQKKTKAKTLKTSENGSQLES